MEAPNRGEAAVIAVGTGPPVYGWAQSLDHETGEIRCMQTARAVVWTAVRGIQGMGYDLAGAGRAFLSAALVGMPRA